MRRRMGDEYIPPATPQSPLTLTLTPEYGGEGKEDRTIFASSVQLCVSASGRLNCRLEFHAPLAGCRKSANCSAKSPRCRPGCWAYQMLMIFTRLFLTAMRFVIRWILAAACFSTW